MQIQRIQTVYIFLALVAMLIFLNVPYGEVRYIADAGQVTSGKLYVINEYGIMIPAALTSILLLIDIFLYRNMRFQRKVLSLCLLLTLCCAAVVCFSLFRQAGAEGMKAVLSVWDILLPIAVVLELSGLAGIARDIRLLNSYNRLR